MNKPYKAAGMAYDNIGEGVPRDILTWHNTAPFRVWVHARKSNIGHKPISIEFQWIGASKEIKFPSEAETEARMQVARLAVADVNKSSLQASSFRGTPMGQVLDVHASLMVDWKFGEAYSKDKQVSLVNSVKHKGFSEEWLNKHLAGGGNPRPENEELRATGDDSIIIAMAYSQQSVSGTKRPAKRTAEMLGIKTELVYVALRIARKNGWLTSLGTGNSGGTLTEQGLKRFKSINGEAILKRHLKE